MKDTPAMRYGPKDCFPTGLARGMVCHRSCLRRSCQPHGDSALPILIFSTSGKDLVVPLRLCPNQGWPVWQRTDHTYGRDGFSPSSLHLAPSGQFSGLVTTHATQDNQP